jgi:hypothetical protein
MAITGIAAALLLAGCGGSSRPVSIDEPVPSAGPSGPVSADALRTRLLQKADLPGLPALRDFASAELTTHATPQLALCRTPAATGPHEVANVIAESPLPGRVKVFEVLSVYGGEAAAKAAFAQTVADAKACTSYVSGGVAHRVLQLAPIAVGADEAVHYALVTADVVSGDVRTIARRGTSLLLISGFGRPPSGQPLLTYQADVMRKALARLG